VSYADECSIMHLDVAAFVPEHADRSSLLAIDLVMVESTCNKELDE